jgi:2-polyprenyl-3-methyl-5-hydroxy-6-metoxy-1,4-benzoquinol methylase
MKQQCVFVERRNCISCQSAKLTELSQGRYLDDPLRGFLAGDPWGVDPLQFLQTAQWSLTKCADCSQVFHRFILNAEWNERRFSEWMNSEAIQEFEARLHAKNPMWRFEKEVQHISHILRIEKLTRKLRGNRPVKLLDFGCGWGDFLNSCQRFGFDVLGVDRSTARRQGATVKIEPSLSNVIGPFHAIVLFETLEHLDNPLEILAALNPLLTPGGILVLETPDCSGVTDIRTNRDYLLVHPLEHINAFTHETLKSIARRCGFKHMSRPAAFITADLFRVAKVFTKTAIRRGEDSTQLYFRKL